MRSPFLALLSFTLIVHAEPSIGSSTLSGPTSLAPISTSVTATSTLTSTSAPTPSPAPTNSTCSFPAEQWFDQLIDHSAGSDNSKFGQRVQVNNTFYKPGGPLFILQGDESSTMPCLAQFEFARWAPEFGAGLISLEHRYFGKSQPFGNNSYTAENMRFLTLDNVISDTVAVVDWWRMNVTNGVGKNAPVVVFGGSYGGSLATFLRINHPNTFFGAVASAGPVRTFLPVSQYWLDHAPDAAMKVKEGFKQLQEMVDAGNSTEIAQAIAVCNPPKKEERDAFLRDMAGIFGLMLQSNTQYVGPAFNITGFPWDVVANRTLAAPSPLAAVNETINTFCHSLIATDGCFDWTQRCGNSIGAQVIPFEYLSCNYFNFDIGDVAPRSVFAATAPYDSTPFCQQTFNITPPTRTELFAKYHFDEATIRNTTRIIYSQGGADPVRGIARADGPECAALCVRGLRDPYTGPSQLADPRKR